MVVIDIVSEGPTLSQLALEFAAILRSLFF